MAPCIKQPKTSRLDNVHSNVGRMLLQDAWTIAEYSTSATVLPVEQTGEAHNHWCNTKHSHLFVGATTKYDSMISVGGGVRRPKQNAAGATVVTPPTKQRENLASSCRRKVSGSNGLSVDRMGAKSHALNILSRNSSSQKEDKAGEPSNCTSEPIAGSQRK